MGIVQAEIALLSEGDFPVWDAYVHQHPQATLYHLSGWKSVIEKTYGHKTYYFMAKKLDSPLDSFTSQPNEPNKPSKPKKPNEPRRTSPVVGILPLVHLKHFVFGNSLLSIPFFDLGGILADDVEIEQALLSKAVELGKGLKVENIELRHISPLSWFNEINSTNSTDPMNPMNPTNPITFVTKSHKVRMLLDLPESSEALMKSFKAKLRSQIKKPLKEGLNSKIGGPELLEDFYKVFCINMRDLGSPVHSRKLMSNVIEKFPQQARIVMVYKDFQPVACSMIVGFKDTLENPWASSLREYGALSPNMLLYWAMLEYACDNGYRYFDFGRSSPDEGTYKFKEQWGAKPTPLHWHHVSLRGRPSTGEESEKDRFSKAIEYWQKLPVPFTKVLGPMIRKHIGL